MILVTLSRCWTSLWRPEGPPGKGGRQDQCRKPWWDPPTPDSHMKLPSSLLSFHLDDTAGDLLGPGARPRQGALGPAAPAGHPAACGQCGQGPVQHKAGRPGRHQLAKSRNLSHCCFIAGHLNPLCILKPKHYVLYHQQLLIMIQKNIIDAKAHFTSNLLDYDSWCLIWERERVWSSLCLPRNLPRSHLSARSRPNPCLQHIILAGRTIFLMKTFCLQSSPW